MTFQTLFLTGIIIAFASLFAAMMYAWITVNLHQMKPTPRPVEATPARRPDSEPLKLAA